MTDREKAIVMAHTGICMLAGDKFQIFHKYIEDLMGKPIWTHEIGWLADEIKEKSKADFMALCADESSSEKPNNWIPVSERLPNRDEYIENNGLFNVSDGNRSYSEWFDVYDTQRFGEPTMYGFRIDHAVTAWMPLPEPYTTESEDKDA